jgi:hypothetical protein
LPPVQTRLVQFAAVMQALPSMHAGQMPPQSTSVSVPSFTPSLQVSREQTPALQMRPEGQITPTHADDTHAFDIQTWPEGQSTAPQLVGTHAPPAQVVPASQARPKQARSTQTSVAQTWVPAQVSIGQSRV